MTATDIATTQCAFPRPVDERRLPAGGARDSRDRRRDRRRRDRRARARAHRGPVLGGVGGSSFERQRWPRVRPVHSSCAAARSSHARRRMRSRGWEGRGSRYVPSETRSVCPSSPRRSSPDKCRSSPSMRMRSRRRLAQHARRPSAASCRRSASGRPVLLKSAASVGDPPGELLLGGGDHPARGGTRASFSASGGSARSIRTHATASTSAGSRL